MSMHMHFFLAIDEGAKWHFGRRLLVSLGEELVQE